MQENKSNIHNSGEQKAMRLLNTKEPRGGWAQVENSNFTQPGHKSSFPHCGVAKGIWFAELREGCTIDDWQCSLFNMKAEDSTFYV